MTNPFVYEICTYLANTLADFTFGTGSTNLKIGELLVGEDGVYAQVQPSPAPDKYTPTEEHVIDFWAVNKRSDQAFDHISKLYSLLHKAITYDTSNYHVYLSRALSQPLDLDRDGEGRKVVKLSVLFIVRGLIS